ncbi:MAG: NAD(P)-dependent oxidoreductase [Nitrospiraceae bacterium]|nr:MAG: NAD(P)-dependent oxidoreductase [Nitrospiraceae bacterium]
MHQHPRKSRRHVIITGGAGFIGSQVSARFLKEKTRVTILTRNVSAPRAMALAQQGCKVVACDFSDVSRMPRPDGLDPADVLFHFAADVSVSSPTLKAANVDGTSRAVALADALAIPYVVYASSIEAQGLGSESEIPLHEDMACRPVSDYGRSKVEAEEIVTAWGSLPGHQALELRIGNIYGPGSAWFLYPSLLALLGATPIRTIWAQLRHRLFQPLFIDDFVEGLWRAVDRRLTGTYNITGGEQVTIEGYVSRLASLTQLTDRVRLMYEPAVPSGRSLPIAPDFAYVLMGTQERCHRAYDNSRLCAEIGPYARWPLSRGLAATLQWYNTSGQLPALLAALRRQPGAMTCM